MKDEERLREIARQMAEPIDWLAKGLQVGPKELPAGYRMRIVKSPLGDNLFIIEPIPENT